jgi:hypothetical protein
MRTKQAGLIPASIPAEKIKKSDTAAQEAHQTRQTAAMEQARTVLKRIGDLAAANNSLAVRNELQAFAADQKQIKKLPQRIVVAHVCCKNCRSGYLKATLFAGQGKETRTTELGTMPVPTDFAQI